MVLDYCPRGDLALFLAQKVVLTEEEARFFICEILLAVEHLHSHDIIYRDMKPENILIGSYFKNKFEIYMKFSSL